MSVMAGEAGAQTAAAAAAAAQKAAGSGPGKGVLAALAIVLLMVGFIALYVAFEGSSILGETVPAKGSGGASYFKAAIQGLRNQVQGTPVKAAPGSSSGTSGG